MKIIKEIIPYIIIIIVVVLIRSFIITPIRVDGPSMNPTLYNGELLLLKKYDHNYKRFDIVVFTYNDKRLIKRIIGLPGETIKYVDNKLYVNGKYVKEDFKHAVTYDFDLGDTVIPKGYYFVLGDNRTNSSDSRIIGPISKKNIQGKTDIRFFPFTKIGKFK